MARDALCDCAGQQIAMQLSCLEVISADVNNSERDQRVDVMRKAIQDLQTHPYLHLIVHQ